MTYSQAILNGDRLALSRLLTQVENDTPESRMALIELFPHTGKAHIIGVTGAPGTGKSSLVNQLALQYRKAEKKRVAIIAVDPSSPFTGGAVLGDRVRMRDLYGDVGIFIRSTATRGSLGGLAKSTANMAQIFDAAGFDLIIIETVGAGQSEVDVARLAHTTLVVEAPGLGDDIQAIKAGILEIADILVINKADHIGVEMTEKALKSMLELAHPAARIFQHHGAAMQAAAPPQKLPAAPLWIPPIQRTIATEGKGIAELAESIARHAAHLTHSGDWAARERTRIEMELDLLIREELISRFRQTLPQNHYEKLLTQIIQREISPGETVKLLLDGRRK